MKRKRILAVMFLLMFAFGAAKAQMVSPVGLGVRLDPDGAGFTGKFFLDRHLAIEGQLNASGGYYNVNNDGPSMTVTGLLEYHFILPDPSWRIFIGPGLHFGTWDRYSTGWEGNYSSSAQGIFGIDGILGVEYVFKSIPIGISADVKPAINFASDVAFFPNNSFGISGRYYVGRMMAHHRKVAAPREQ